MTSIDHMVSARPGLTPQVDEALTHAILWASNVFLDHYSDYCCYHLMRGTSEEETLRSKEAYRFLEYIHRASVCAYREDNGIFAKNLFKEAVQTC